MPQASSSRAILWPKGSSPSWVRKLLAPPRRAKAAQTLAGAPPVRGLTSWFLGELVGYRLYILAWTYADIVLTAWLVGKASRSKKLGIA